MRFEDVRTGQHAEISHQLTAEDVQRFVELTGDDNRLHVDAAFAAGTSLKKPVVHGMLGASFISTIIGTKLPGDGALWFEQTIEFLLPVRLGDTLAIRAEVTAKHESTRVIELRTTIANQYRQVVTQGTAKVKLIEPEVTAEADSPAVPGVALVVGGSGGIGAAVCRKLAADGFAIAVHHFTNAATAGTLAAEITTAGGRACVCRADITKPEDIAAMIDLVAHRLGPVSVLVNCSTVKIAAIKFADLTAADFEAHWRQVEGAFHLVRAVAPAMEQKKYGKIIHLDTQYVDQPEPHLSAYIAAKGGLRALTRSLALDLAPKGIRVNMVSPGMTNTEQIADVPDRVRLMTAARTPLRRLASPQDVAAVVAFLASAGSDYLCGETIRVNGGQLMA
jgi:3-oxoacyl-[acyl-carrier protein] reductase